nr:AAA family ATPase [Qipengyuania algicida]
MNKLGLACRALDAEFQTEEAAIDRILAVPLPSTYSNGTPVHETIAKLVPATSLEHLPDEDALRALGTWGEAEEAALASVTEQLESDPQAQARLRKATKRALETVRRDISNGLAAVSDEAICELIQAEVTANNKSKAAEVAAQELFAKQPISEIGSETWRQMLSYAREFAARVYEGRDPPELATGERCVLCQQELADDAAARLKAFDDFIVGRAAEEAESAHNAFVQKQNGVLDTNVMAKDAVETMLSGYAAQSDATAAIAALIATFADQLGERLGAVKAALRAEDWDALDRLAPLNVSPIPSIDAEIERLNSEIEALEGTERDEEALAKLRKRLAELTDQKLLNAEIDVVIERRDRLEERCRIKNCRKECAFGGITRRITARRREILTPSLRTKLKDELTKLRLTHLPIDLSDRGEGAESIIEVALTAQQRIANNSDILSEGEQRALALACFLAEADDIGATHGIIVDDPVSSLDHTRMEAVAKRLAEEAAKGRQIIIFTHNILFHYMMVTEARRALIAWHTEWMSSLGDDQFGIIDDARKPWQIKKVPERLSDLAADLSELKKAGYDPKNQEFRSSLIGFYTRMRETWERIVEEVLLNGAIQRFRPEVMTMRLEDACLDPTTDYPQIFEGMSRCSLFSGHDRAVGMPEELPELSDIETDYDNLKAFSDAARQRQKALQKAPKHEDGMVPVFA